MIRAVLYLCFTTVLLMIVSCSGNDPISQTDSFTTKDTTFLADKNFVYHDLKNTKEIKYFYKKNNVDEVYTDSTFQKNFPTLSANQRGLLFAPFLAKGFGIKYAKDEMFGWFVSKQNKIGDFQSIIIQENGVHDFASLMLMILDKDYHAISQLNLNEENAAIDYSAKPHISRSYSVINKNQILSYRIAINTDSAKKQVTIDSAVFTSRIDENGHIGTKQTVKAHLVKSF